MNTELLMRTLKARHVSIGDMCQQLGMSRSAFYRKTRGISEFTEGEIERVCTILNLDSPMDIFFSPKVS